MRQATTIDATSSFLVELAQALHAVSVPADVTERLITNGAHRLGAETDLALFQSYAELDVASRGQHEVRIKRIDFESHWDLRRARQLTDLARSVGDGRLGLDEAHRRLAIIEAAPRRYTKALVVLGYAAYSAAVTARIGGAVVDVIAGALVGVLAGAIHYGAGRSRSIDLQQSFLAGLVGSLAAFVLGSVLPIDFAKVLFGGITLLVPAMVVTIAIHELANDALESGSVRLLYGLLRFLMLGFGAAVASRSWTLFASLPSSIHGEPLPFVAVTAILVLGGLALVVCLQARPRDIPWIVAAVLIAYGSQELTKLVFGDAGSPFAAAFVLGVVAELHSRYSGHLAGAMIVPGLLQLAPGFLGTRAVLDLLAGRAPDQPTAFVDVFLIALQLATGLLVAALLFRRFGSKRALRVKSVAGA